MAHTPDETEKFGTVGTTGPPNADEEQILEEGLRRLREEKVEALRDPGPSWREWFLYRASKFYVIVGFLIVNSWEVASFLPFAPPLGFHGLELFAVLAPTVYAEFLVWRFLWYRPDSDREASHRRGAFRRSWARPVPYGRWTPEAAAIRAGEPVPALGSAPDPREFL